MSDELDDGTRTLTPKKKSPLHSAIITIELLESEYDSLQFESSIEQLEQHARELKKKCLDYNPSKLSHQESEKLKKMIKGLKLIVNDVESEDENENDEEDDDVISISRHDPIERLLSGLSRPELSFESLYPVSCFTDAQTFDWILIPHNQEYRDHLSELITEFKNIKANMVLWKRENNGTLTFQGMIRKPPVSSTVKLTESEANLQKNYVTDGFINIIEADASDLKDHHKNFDFRLNDQNHFRQHSLPKSNISNCYSIFNTTSEKAFEDIYGAIHNHHIREYLLMAVEDAIITADFALYLNENYDKFKSHEDIASIDGILGGHTNQKFDNTFFDFANNDLIIKIYLHYHFNVVKQWPHPGILYCLAELNNKHLFLYAQKTYNEITEHPCHIAPKQNDKIQIHLLLPDKKNHYFDVLENVKHQRMAPTPAYFIAQTENEFSLNYSNAINLQKKSKTQGIRKNFNHSYNPFHPNKLRLAGIHELIDHLDFLVFLKHDTNKGKISDQAISLHCLAIEKTIEEILLSFSLLERNSLLAGFLLKKEKNIQELISKNLINQYNFLKEYKDIVLRAVDLYPNIKDGINSDDTESNLQKLWQIKKDSNYRYVNKEEKHFHNAYIITNKQYEQNALPPNINGEESRYIKLKLLSDPDDLSKDYDIKVKSEIKTISLYTARSGFKEKLRTALVAVTTIVVAGAAGFLAFYFIPFSSALLTLALLTAAAFVAAGALAYLVCDKLTQDLWKKRFRNLKEDADEKIKEVKNKFKETYQNLMSPKKNLSRNIQSTDLDVDFENVQDSLEGLDILDKVNINSSMLLQTPVLLQDKNSLTALINLLKTENMPNQLLLSHAVLCDLENAVKEFVTSNPIIAKSHKTQLNEYYLDIKKLLLLPEDMLMKDDLLKRAKELVENMKKFILALDKGAASLEGRNNKRQEIQPQLITLPQQINPQTAIVQVQVMQNPTNFNETAIKVADELNALFSEKKEIMSLDKNPENHKLNNIITSEKKLNKTQESLFNQNFQIMPLHHWKNYVEHREAGIEAYQRKIDGVNKKLLEIQNTIKPAYQSDIESINQYINSDEVNLEDLVSKLEKLENRLKENNCIPRISKNKTILSANSIDQNMARDNFNQQIAKCNKFIKNNFEANLPKTYKELRDEVDKQVQKTSVDFALLTTALQKLQAAFSKASLFWDQDSTDQHPVRRSPTKRNLLKEDSPPAYTGIMSKSTSELPSRSAPRSPYLYKNPAKPLSHSSPAVPTSAAPNPASASTSSTASTTTTTTFSNV
jgi:hypothetical protein